MSLQASAMLVTTRIRDALAAVCLDACCFRKHDVRVSGAKRTSAPLTALSVFLPLWWSSSLPRRLTSEKKCRAQGVLRTSITPVLRAAGKRGCLEPQSVPIQRLRNYQVQALSRRGPVAGRSLLPLVIAKLEVSSWAPKAGWRSLLVLAYPAWTSITSPAYCKKCLLQALMGPQENMKSHIDRMAGLDLGGLTANMESASSAQGRGTTDKGSLMKACTLDLREFCHNETNLHFERLKRGENGKGHL